MIFSYEIMRQQYYLKQMQINSHEYFLQLSSGIVNFPYIMSQQYAGF